MTDIFISYSSADVKKAREIAQALEKEGLSVWWDRTILPGQKFSTVIENALDNAHCIVVLWSSKSAESDWVHNEADEGMRRNILVPALIENIRIPLQFRGIHAVSLVDWKPTSSLVEFEQFVSAIKSNVLQSNSIASEETEQLEEEDKQAITHATDDVLVKLEKDSEEISSRAIKNIPTSQSLVDPLPEKPELPLSSIATPSQRIDAESPSEDEPVKAQSEPPKKKTLFKPIIAVVLIVVLSVGSMTAFQYQQQRSAEAERQIGLELEDGATAEAEQQRVANLADEVELQIDDTTATERQLIADAAQPTFAAPVDPLNLPVWVEGGTFSMGTEDGKLNEKPVHQVTITGFWMQEHEVTNAEFLRFDPTHTFLTGQEQHPVTEIAWQQAMDYAESVGGRLPTEAQWEFAARGISGRTYPWGDEEPTCELAHYSECGIAGTIPVMTRPAGATPEGIHDLGGNVWEWTADGYSQYEVEAQTDPIVRPNFDSNRVLRGGSFNYDVGGLRGGNRLNFGPKFEESSFGLRVVWVSPVEEVDDLPAFALPDLANDERNVPIWIKGGTFTMGSTGEDPDEQPIHQVTVAEFWMQQHEVTNEEYSSFEPSHQFPAGMERHPVHSVTWNEATAYAISLGGSLPTEAEWEFAARGPLGRTYPWGEESPTCLRAHFKGCDPIDSTALTIPVMSLADGSTPEGLHDLSGNLWEWVYDWYTPYNIEPISNPTGPLEGRQKVIRGGSFIRDPEDMRASDRGADVPYGRSNNYGFRVVWSSAH